MSFRLASLTLTLSLVAFAGCSSEPEAPPAPPPAEEAPKAENTEDAAKEPAEDEAAPEEKTAIVATIGAMNGKVTVNKKPATVGQELAAGDVIATKKRANADIYMSDNSRVRLGANARLEVGSIDVEKGLSVNLLLGKLYSWITPGTGYEVVTGNAVAGVRGTKFYVEEKKKKTYVCVCEGEVAVKGDKNDEEIALKEGFDLYARRKKASAPKESPARMLKDVNSVFDELAASKTSDGEDAEAGDDGAEKQDAGEEADGEDTAAEEEKSGDE
ncbi:MAG: FecR family protein [Myxococcota bacterium]